MFIVDSPYETVAGQDRNTQEGLSYVTSAVRQWQGEVGPSREFRFRRLHVVLLFDPRLTAVRLSRVGRPKAGGLRGYLVRRAQCARQGARAVPEAC